MKIKIEEEEEEEEGERLLNEHVHKTDKSPQNFQVVCLSD